MAKPRLEPTPEFYRFGLGFYRDLDMRGKTEDEVWAIVLDPFTGQDRIRLRDFLDKITRDAVSDADLLRLWNATPADYWVSDLRVVFKQARDRLLQPPNRPSWRGHDRSGRANRDRATPPRGRDGPAMPAFDATTGRPRKAAAADIALFTAQATRGSLAGDGDRRRRAVRRQDHDLAAEHSCTGRISAMRRDRARLERSGRSFEIFSASVGLYNQYSTLS